MSFFQKHCQMAILSLHLPFLYQTTLHYLLNVFQAENSTYSFPPSSTEENVVTALCHNFCETKYWQSSKHNLELFEHFESNSVKSPSSHRQNQTFVQFVFQKYCLNSHKYPRNLLLMSIFFPNIFRQKLSILFLI